MGDIGENDCYDNRLIGRTIRDINNNSTALIIPKEFAKELNIENSKVAMFLLKDFDDNKYLAVTKYHKEIVIK